MLAPMDIVFISSLNHFEWLFCRQLQSLSSAASRLTSLEIAELTVAVTNHSLNSTQTSNPAASAFRNRLALPSSDNPRSSTTTSSRGHSSLTAHSSITVRPIDYLTEQQRQRAEHAVLADLDAKVTQAQLIRTRPIILDNEVLNIDGFNIYICCFDVFYNMSMIVLLLKKVVVHIFN